MRGLKILVILMGVLILAGVGVLGALIAGKMVKPAAPVTAAFSAPPLDLPAGARIETMAAGGDRIVLDLVLADGSRELVVVDLKNGKKLGTIPLHQGP